MKDNTITEKEKQIQIEKQIAEAENNLFEENYKQCLSRYKKVSSKLDQARTKREELFIKLLEANHDYLKYLLKLKHANQGIFFFEEEAKK